MMQKSTTFTTIFRVKKCYFHYNFACKKVPLPLRYGKKKFNIKSHEHTNKPNRFSCQNWLGYFISSEIFAAIISQST
jgi:hypothetical protein